MNEKYEYLQGRYTLIVQDITLFQYVQSYYKVESNSLKKKYFFTYIFNFTYRYILTI